MLNRWCRAKFRLSEYSSFDGMWSIIPFSKVFKFAFLNVKLAKELTHFPSFYGMFSVFLPIRCPFFKFLISKLLVKYCTVQESPKWGVNESEIWFRAPPAFCSLPHLLEAVVAEAVMSTAPLWPRKSRFQHISWLRELANKRRSKRRSLQQTADCSAKRRPKRRPNYWSNRWSSSYPRALIAITYKSLETGSNVPLVHSCAPANCQVNAKWTADQTADPAAIWHRRLLRWLAMTCATCTQLAAH